MRKNNYFYLIKFFLLINCLVITFSSCSLDLGNGGGTVKIRYPNKISPEMQNEYNIAEAKFKARSYSQAFQLYQAYLKKYPYTRLSDRSNFRIGQVYMLRRAYNPAIQIFSELANKTPDPMIRSKALVKAGISSYRLRRFQQALDFFNRSESRYLTLKERVKSNSLAYYANINLRNSVEKYAYNLLELIDAYSGSNNEQVRRDFGIEAPVKSLVLSKLQTWAVQPVPPSQVDARILNYKSARRPSEPFILIKLGVVYEQAANKNNAKRYLKQYMRYYPNDSFAALASKLLKKMGESNFSRGGKNLKIGVILPLTGSYATYGQKTLRGMQCAAGVKVECRGLQNVELIIKDDKGMSSLANQAVEDLVLNQEVKIIIGPLVSKVSESAALKAKEYDVVMISLAQKPDIATLGKNIYSLGLTPEDQVNAILKEIKTSGNSSFSILYPKNNYGNIFSEQARKQASSIGLEVNGRIAYPNASLDFSTELNKLPRSTRAIFVPDSIKSVLTLMGQMEAFGLSSATLYGTNAWNDARIAKFVRGKKLIFVDSFFSDSKRVEVKNFVQEFGAAHGYIPSTLEAMGYDAVMLIGKTIGTKRIRNIDHVNQSLQKLNNFEGVTGLKGFNRNGNANIKAIVLKTQGDKIVEK